MRAALLCAAAALALSWRASAGPGIAGFDGREFEFQGRPGRYYSLITEEHHQLSMGLSAKHDGPEAGTYLSALGLRYRNHTVLVGHGGDDIAVTLDGEPMAAGQDWMAVPPHAEGALTVRRELQRPGYGSAVQLTTELLDVLVWVTPAEAGGEGGAAQPTDLNFEVTLVAAPADGALQGLVGETYGLEAAAAEADDAQFHGVAAAYEAATLFAAPHQAPSLISRLARLFRARKLLAAAQPVAFPLRAGSGRGRTLMEAAQPVVFPLRAGCGRGRTLREAGQPVAFPLRAGSGRGRTLMVTPEGEEAQPSFPMRARFSKRAAP